MRVSQGFWVYSVQKDFTWSVWCLDTLNGPCMGIMNTLFFPNFGYFAWIWEEILGMGFSSQVHTVLEYHYTPWLTLINLYRIALGVAGADPGFFLEGCAPLRNGVTGWWGKNKRRRRRGCAPLHPPPWICLWVGGGEVERQDTIQTLFTWNQIEKARQMHLHLFTELWNVN